MVVELEISKLERTGLQTRAALNAEAIRDYAAVMEGAADGKPEDGLADRAVLPPVEVYREGDVYRLSDGFHRVAAALSLGRATIAAEVKDGDYRAALTAALRANLTHGMRRTGADKRKAMQTAWDNRTVLWDHTPTEREFSAVCGVSNGTAHNFLADIALLKMSSPTPREADGGPQPAPAGPQPTAGNSQPHDRFQLEIPEPLVPVFARWPAAPAAKFLKNAQKLLAKAQASQEKVYAAIPFQRIDIALTNALNELRFARPYCVCRMCRGDGCPSCNRRGFMTKPQYDQLPEAYKYIKDIDRV